jgi:transposase
MRCQRRVGRQQIGCLTCEVVPRDLLPFVSTYYPERRVNRRLSPLRGTLTNHWEVVRIYIGLDVHKRAVYVTEMEDNGNVKEQYEIVNDESAWIEFRERYLSKNPEISLEVSTSGKYAARKLRDMGFSVHLADPSKLSLIFNTGKKNRRDRYKLAKLLRLGELPEVHLSSRYSYDLRSLIRYRRSLGESITMLKNRAHAILASAGIAAMGHIRKEGDEMHYGFSG